MKSIPLLNICLLSAISTLLFPEIVSATVDSAPKLVEISPVSRDTIALMIQQGEVRLHRLIPYIAEEGDRIEESMEHYSIKEEYGIVFKRIVYRDDEFYGYLSGQGEKSIILPDKYSGIDLGIDAAMDPASYKLYSNTDTSFSKGVQPAKVSRKAKPNSMARHEHKVGALHTVFLKFPHPLKEGSNYSLDLSALKLDQRTANYTYEPRFQRSEAVHVNQVGFAPGDPVKRAFVSIWTGVDGGLSFGPSVKFHVVDQIRGIRAYSGKAELHWPANKPEKNPRNANLVGADVYRLDFPGLAKPGRYHVYVEGIGCSYPFEIRPDAWKVVATTSFRGIFHQRSGIEFGPPYTDYWRPRAHNSQFGVKVYQSRTTLLETTMGIELGKGKPVFPTLIEGATDELVLNAWGGVMDGGDWDRRAQHLVIPRLFLEAYQLSPEFYESFTYNIPESGNQLPDIIDEALWILDFYHRMQRTDGAVSGGVESAEHPAPGDMSWNESIPVYAYWPDFWSTHEFVSAAAMASRVLADEYPAMSAKYKEAALKGMLWAEKEWAKEVASGRSKERVAGVFYARNLAAIELYRITGDEHWHDVFIEDTVLGDSTSLMQSLEQKDALFSYMSLPDGLGKPEWKRIARETIIAIGDAAVEYSKSNAYSLVAPSRETPVFIGYFSGLVHGQALVRAHALTGDDRYLEALHAGAQFALGSNPDNVVYMSGLGSERLEWILYEDSIKTGRPVPEGIIPYGPFDHGESYVKPGSFWVVSLEAFGAADDPTRLEPGFWDWPVAESHIDMWNLFMQDECTPWQTMAPSAYSWGYIAAQAEGR
ncbi:MAG: glycoside hydrolase family 9 protein [Puniceicoccaceae bacterium]